MKPDYSVCLQIDRRQLATLPLLCLLALCWSAFAGSLAAQVTYDGIDPSIKKPSLTFKAAPRYTDAARVAGLEGTVVVSCAINRQGVPVDIKVVESLGLGLDEAAVKAVTRWRFEPAIKDGTAVAVAASVKVDFILFDKARKTSIGFWTSTQRLEREVARHPDNSSARMNLISHYTLDLASFSPEQALAGRSGHILWMIQHQPFSPYLASSLCLFNLSNDVLADPVAYKKGRDIWLEQVQKVDDPLVLENAARYLEVNEAWAAAQSKRSTSSIRI